MRKRIFKIPFVGFSLLILFAQLFNSCKKDTPQPSNSNSATVWQTYSLPSNSAKYSGILDFTQNITFSNNPYSYGVYDNELSAYFSKIPTYSDDPNFYVSVDSVSVNNFRLPFNQVYYYSSSFPSINVPLTWKVTSHNGITSSLIYTNPDSMPRYAGFLNLPDTIFLNKPLTVNLTGLYNMDSLQIQFFVYSNSNFMASSPTLPKNVHSFSLNFTQSQVSSLTPSQVAQIRLTVKKVNTRNFLGKNYTFTNTMNFEKYNVIVQ